MSLLGDMIVRIVGDNAQFDNAIDKSSKKHDSFVKQIEKGGKSLTKFVTLPLVALGTAAVKAAADMEMQEVAFTTLLGSATKAKNLLSELKTFAAKTPFALGDLTRSTQTLIGFGLETDKAVTVMKQIGDIAQGNKDKFGSLSLAFAQASSTGKLMGQDLLQMINAGFNPLLQISEDTGVSIAELKKKMEKGEISVTMLEDAFRNATSEGGRFYGGMENASTTLTGKFSTLLDTVVDTARSFGEVLLPTIKIIIDRATALAEKFTNLTDGQKKFILIVGGVAAAIGPLMLIAAKLVTVFNTLKTAVLAAMVAMKAMDAATKTTVAGLALAGIGLLVGAIITFGKETKTADDNLSGLNNALDDLQGKINAINEGLRNSDAARLTQIASVSAYIATLENQINVAKRDVIQSKERQAQVATWVSELALARAELVRLNDAEANFQGSKSETDKRAAESDAQRVARLQNELDQIENLSLADQLRLKRQLEAEAAVLAEIERMREEDKAKFLADIQEKIEAKDNMALADLLRGERQAEATAAVEAAITRMTQEEEAKRVKAAQDAATKKTNIQNAWFSVASATISALSSLTTYKYDAELAAAEGNDKEIRRIMREQAKATKLYAIFDVAIKTAMAVIGFLATLPPNVPGAIAAGITGAIQAAVVLAQPLPALARGAVVMPTPGGTPFIAGEAGMPEAIFPLDRLGEILASIPNAGGTSAGDSMIHLQVNMDSQPFLDKIFPASQNGRIMIDARVLV